MDFYKQVYENKMYWNIWKVITCSLSPINWGLWWPTVHLKAVEIPIWDKNHMIYQGKCCFLGKLSKVRPFSALFQVSVLARTFSPWLWSGSKNPVSPKRSWAAFQRAHQTRVHPLVLYTEPKVLPKAFASGNMALLNEHFQKKISYFSKAFQITPAPVKKKLNLPLLLNTTFMVC